METKPNDVIAESNSVPLQELGVDSSLGDRCSILFELCDFENPQHLKALAELTNHYMEDPMGGFPPLNKLDQLRLVNGLANHPTAEVHFAILDSTVVGLATCFVNFSTFYVKPYLYIHDIVVFKNYRGKGIGKALIEYLTVLCIEREFCKKTLEVREDNKVAKSLYKDIGFDECDPKMLFWTKKLNDYSQ
ncbi:MAG: GNAT family N-acetyltransferase [Paludibacter sp.]|nr:GNAT family N-acetyltransferase [Paludibacter sp.]